MFANRLGCVVCCIWETVILDRCHSDSLVERCQLCASSASKTTRIFAGSGVRVLAHKMLANGRLEEALACLLVVRNCACPRTLLGQQSDNFWDQYDSYIKRNWRATALLR